MLGRAIWHEWTICRHNKKKACCGMWFALACLIGRIRRKIKATWRAMTRRVSLPVQLWLKVDCGVQLAVPLSASLLCLLLVPRSAERGPRLPLSQPRLVDPEVVGLARTPRPILRLLTRNGPATRQSRRRHRVRAAVDTGIYCPCVFPGRGRGDQNAAYLSAQV